MKPTIPFKSLALAALCAALFAGCATTGTSDALEAARNEVNAAAVNPDVVARAPLELRTAQEALDRANNAQRKGEDRAEVNHHAYLAQTRAQTARDLASARRATDDLARMQGEVDRLRLAARTQEAQIARAQAAAASQQAASAAQQAQAATAQAQAATQEALKERSRADQAMADAEAANNRTRVLILELQARETERGLLVTLGDVLFQTGKAELLPTAHPRMDKLAEFLKQFPDKSLLIEGYTDSVGSDSYNQELSMRRAEAVKAALMQRGVDPVRMGVRGYGEAFPVASNDSPEGRALNRRVEVVVSDERGTLQPRLSSR